eukprot:CAMPEP_0114316554 /NCGR_PEP_ID=MMETSP0059-20121206/23282_1 /TAXON_ID=36894 /ORGANISM="Pyramimonas parkeae, Strain CCMP726" /LENGTH=64 /DNA_ID=CAMNT_0001442527 /DNA_START=428 /DNA_END=618 /DNA_ORIENTATION=-
MSYVFSTDEEYAVIACEGATHTTDARLGGVFVTLSSKRRLRALVRAPRPDATHDECRALLAGTP